MATNLRSASRLRTLVEPLSDSPWDYDSLLHRIGDARIVLLGEATHGTHEFYRERASITKRLIRERGFHAVAIEADFPDAYRVNMHVRGNGDDAGAVDALGGFKRFPTWMWRNADVLDFVGWLADYNREHLKSVGFFGLDLYSLHGSMHTILKTLGELDPEAAERARQHYACFDHFQSAEDYARASSFGLKVSCERQVTQQLLEMLQRTQHWLLHADHDRIERGFCLEQNARVVKNAEHYYRTLLHGAVHTWNLRDRHLFETLEALSEHLDDRVGRGKIVVWAHNNHLGDARATSRAQQGELNLGQLVRQRFGNTAYSVGFTTHGGTVTAASDWGGPAERKTLRPALPTSYEALFHRAHLPRFLLHLGSHAALGEPGLRSGLERAIGVVYRPATERQSHYFRADLAEQFDAVIHFDHTRAIEPLEMSAEWTAGEAPDAFPFAV